MAWKKYPTRSKHKRYKRFSSAKIKTRSAGPSKDVVFSGGRMIPVDAKSLFDYRNRGLLQFEQVKQIKLYADLHSHYQQEPTPPEDAWFISYVYAMMLKDLSNWRELVRKTTKHEWNFIDLIPGHFFTTMFFSGRKFFIVQQGLDGAVRRSIVYKNHTTVMRDFERDQIMWTEILDLSSEPALNRVSPSPDAGTG